MEDDKSIQFQAQMNLTIPKVSEAGGGKFKLVPNTVYSLEELWEYISRYKDIHKNDYTIWLCLDNVNQFIKVLVK